MAYHPRFLPAIAVVSLILAATTMSPAEAAPTDSRAEEPERALLKEFSPSLRSLLKSNGVDEATVEVVRKSGYTMVSDADAWVVYDADKESVAVDTSSASSPAPAFVKFDAGICAGKFGDIRKVNGKVEWSAWDSCAATSPNAIYQHKLKSTLRESGGPFDWFMLDLQTATAAGSAYSPALTAFGDRKCKSTSIKNFDQVVVVRFHSVDFGPKVSSTTTLACDA